LFQKAKNKLQFVTNDYKEFDYEWAVELDKFREKVDQLKKKEISDKEL